MNKKEFLELQEAECPTCQGTSKIKAKWPKGCGTLLRTCSYCKGFGLFHGCIENDRLRVDDVANKQSGFPCFDDDAAEKAHKLKREYLEMKEKEIDEDKLPFK